MAELAALARPYSEAVFTLAEEKGQIDGWSDTLEFLTLIMSDKLLSKAANNPKVSKEAFQTAVLEICDGQMDESGLNFVKLLIKNGRLQMIGDIAKQFEVRKADKKGVLDISVTSAFPFSEEDLKELTSSLSKSFGKKVKISAEEDQSLIGGMIIRAGDKVIDGSLSGQIQQLAKQLK